MLFNYTSIREEGKQNKAGWLVCCPGGRGYLILLVLASYYRAEQINQAYDDDDDKETISMLVAQLQLH